MGLARIACIVCTSVAWLPQAALPAGAGACRQALAFALDVSASVDTTEYRLQLDGLASALTDPQVAAVLLAEGTAPLRLLVFEWSGPSEQRIVAGWREIADRAGLEALAHHLRATVRRPATPSTALGTALSTGARLLADQADCARRTLDISGDGRSNAGPGPQSLAGLAALDGVTVNALVIGDGAERTGGDGGRLMTYFESEVIRGPGAFVEPADDFTAYAAAMKRKLLRELEGLVVGAAQPGQAVAPAAPLCGSRMQRSLAPVRVSRCSESGRSSSARRASASR